MVEEAQIRRLSSLELAAKENPENDIMVQC